MRGLRPATHLSTAQIDAVVEAAERAVLIDVARSTSKSCYLKGGAGPDSAGIKLAATYADAQILARALLPDTDLNAGAVAYDRWRTQALVAGTELNFVVNTTLRADQAVAIYGVGTQSATPGISRVRLMEAGSTVMAAWDCNPLWSAQDTIGYADEFVMWSAQGIINVWLMPDLTVALGEVFGLLGVIAEPKGIGPLTK